MRIIIITALAIFLSACSTSIYRLGVQQGNIVTDDMLEKLEVGMTESQVKFVLGNPVIRNTLNPNEWDYLYRFEREGSYQATYKITLHFEDGIYKRLEGSNKAKENLSDPEPVEEKAVSDSEQREQTKTDS